MDLLIKSVVELKGLFNQQHFHGFAEPFSTELIKIDAAREVFGIKIQAVFTFFSLQSLFKNISAKKIKDFYRGQAIGFHGKPNGGAWIERVGIVLAQGILICFTGTIWCLCDCNFHRLRVTMPQARVVHAYELVGIRGIQRNIIINVGVALSLVGSPMSF